jgi:hypothetical protein
MATIAFLGPQELKRVKELVEFASLPENHFVPLVSPTPGDNPAYCVMLGTVRAVFTLTISNGALYRHLSLSIPQGQDGPCRFPNLVISEELARHFGFTGGLDNWMVSPEHDQGALVIAQHAGEIPPVWSVYDKPLDFPTKVVVRKWHGIAPTLDAMLFDTLEEAREHLAERGLINVGRNESDQTQIVESWI